MLDRKVMRLVHSSGKYFGETKEIWCNQEKVRIEDLMTMKLKKHNQGLIHKHIVILQKKLTENIPFVIRCITQISLLVLSITGTGILQNIRTPLSVDYLLIVLLQSFLDYFFTYFLLSLENQLYCFGSSIKFVLKKKKKIPIIYRVSQKSLRSLSQNHR